VANGLTPSTLWQLTQSFSALTASCSAVLGTIGLRSFGVGNNDTPTTTATANRIKSQSTFRNVMERSHRIPVPRLHNFLVAPARRV
jgi:hypothetical protein